jgi:hypothetical protein
MSETKQLLSGKKVITPLWIVALFVSLTETVLGFAVIQTAGGIQIALTAFVIVFPLLIAGFFFAILWKKPYVFYPPTEFGAQVNVREFVAAMDGRPTSLRQDADGEAEYPPTEREVKAADQIVDSFVSRLATNALFFLYAFSLAHSQKKPIDFADLNSAIERQPGDTYGMGILSATAGTGLLTYTKSFEEVEIDGKIVTRTVANIIDMNEKLKAVLRDGLHRRIQKRLKDEGSNWDVAKQKRLQQWADNKMTLINQYFTDDSESA